METCEVTFNKTQPCNSSVFECAGDDEVGNKIFEDKEDDAGEDVPSTSTTTTTMQDGPSPTIRSSKIKWKQLLRGRLSPGERHEVRSS
jgi:hypothetical protein